MTKTNPICDPSGAEAVCVGAIVQGEDSGGAAEGGGHLVQTGFPQHHHESVLGHGTLPGQL